MSQVQVGQRVVPLIQRPDLTGQGTWQEYIVLPETYVVPYLHYELIIYLEEPHVILTYINLSSSFF